MHYISNGNPYYREGAQYLRQVYSPRSKDMIAGLFSEAQRAVITSFATKIYQQNYYMQAAA